MRSFLAVLILSVAGAGMLCGCGGGSEPLVEPSKPVPNPEPEPVPTAEVTYHFEGGADMSNLFAFEAVYTTADGKTATERISSLPWKKSVTAGMPFDAKLNVRLTAQEVIPFQPLYEVGYNGYISNEPTEEKEFAPEATRVGDKRLRLRFTLPEGASAEEVTLRVAPLKYDKHFAFTFTVDDSYVNAFSRIWSLINAKWVDDKEFYHVGHARSTGSMPDYPLAMTDGCGNDRRFGFSCAIWPTWGNEWNPTFIKDAAQTGDNSQYISWDELGLLSDFGVSMCYHNVDERVYGKTDPARIAAGFEADYQKTLEKLGIRMKVFGLPDGNKTYAEAAQSFNRIAFMRSSLSSGSKIYLHSCGDLRKQSTYGGTNSSDITVKVSELAAQSASSNPYWVGLTVHRPQQDYMDMLKTVYSLYGKAGQDNLWVASWDEVYEYITLREGAKITRTVEGRTVTFDIELPDYSDFLFPQLSFLVEGAEGASVSPMSENIVGLKSAVKQGELLVNVNLDSRLFRLAEKYTFIYEQTAGAAELADARYFVSQLIPSLAAPFERRIGAVENPGENEVTAAGIDAYRMQLNGYEFKTSLKIEAPKK